MKPCEKCGHVPPPAPRRTLVIPIHLNPRMLHEAAIADLECRRLEDPPD